MKIVSQVAQITGVSTRTLQYYDEIELLKPSELTSSGYRLYNEESLQKLQQILFFKELGFKLKDIKEILEKPDFDKISAFKKQKELLLLKRNRFILLSADRLCKSHLLECFCQAVACFHAVFISMCYRNIVYVQMRRCLVQVHHTVK